MSTTIDMVFDGEVFRPESPVNLKPNARYRVTVEEAEPEAPAGDAWAILDAMIGTVDAPPDWSSEHDHYIYGTPKRDNDTPRYHHSQQRVDRASLRG